MEDQVKKLKENAFFKKKLRCALKATDVDKDGMITRRDFELIAERQKEFGGVSDERSAELRKHLMEFCDILQLTEGSPGLTYDQFIDSQVAYAVEYSQPDKTPGYMPAFFAGLDLNGDGHISLEEWTTHYKCLGIDQKHAKTSFDAMDTDGDGEISYDEFVAYHREFYFTTKNDLNSAILYGPLPE